VELLKTLRSVPSTQAIPVLLLSGRAPEEQRVEGFREGADGYLAKPYSERELRALIGSMIHSARQRAELIRREALEEAEQRAVADRAALLESITDMFYALDAQYRFTYINQRALDYLGKTREELLDRSVWDAFPATEGSLLEEQFERVLRTQVSAAFELKSVLSGRWFELRVYPAGEGLSVYLKDVSPRRRAEQELQATLTRLEGREWRLALATRVAGLGVFSWDAQSDCITFESDPLEIQKLSNVTPLTGARLLGDLLHPDDRRAFRCQLARCIRRSEPLRCLCRVRTLEGSWRWLEINGGRGSAGEQGAAHIVGVVGDVTERQKSEEALREADRRKDEFLALLSHELRNPLAPIAHGLAVLRHRNPAEPDVQRMLAIMDRQLTHLSRLVDDLLDVRRITHGKLHLHRQQMPLADVLASAIEACRPLIEKRYHTLRMDVEARGLVVDGDRDRLHQVFTNLIHNSVKYTDPGGNIRITVDRDGNHAVIGVADNGIGIAPNALERVFEMFSQVRAQPTQVGGGLGVGLALVRTIVMMHGGTVHAASAGPGKGSTFTVRLPLVITPVQIVPTEPAPAQAVSNRGLRVLVVDDNADAATALGDLLRSSGHQVMTAATGEEAVEKSQLIRPQLIFMDIGLPGIDGVEAARQIRSLPELQGVTVVAVTGWGQPADRARTQAVGMVAHLLKPVAWESIEQILRGITAAEVESADSQL